MSMSEAIQTFIELVEQSETIVFFGGAGVSTESGTSLAVYPAAGLIDYYRGDRLVLINKTPTPMDDRADLVIQEGLGVVFSALKEREILER